MRIGDERLLLGVLLCAADIVSAGSWNMKEGRTTELEDSVRSLQLGAEPPRKRSHTSADLNRPLGLDEIARCQHVTNKTDLRLHHIERVMSATSTRCEGIDVQPLLQAQLSQYGELALAKPWHTWLGTFLQFGLYVPF
jgi:hypothetical protein